MQPARRGFTLVEMLVSTALVMVVMLMFAQIFSLATDGITKQRGTAQNDQRARSFANILRSDLENRTYRETGDASDEGLVPLVWDMEVDPLQMGYFYISENDPNNEGDDVLQFTAYAPQQRLFTGRAPFLRRPTWGGSAPGSPFGDMSNPPFYNTSDSPDYNQPDGDDGRLQNGIGTSRAAEISYFRRGNNLYRRVLLLRDPLKRIKAETDQPTSGADGIPPRGDNSEWPDRPSSQDDAQRFDELLIARWNNNDGRIEPGDYPMNANVQGGGSVFWNDFDYSATRNWFTESSSAYANTPADPYMSVWFNSVESLDNAEGTFNTPLGIPHNRFGFIKPVLANRAIATGAREHADRAAALNYLAGSAAQPPYEHNFMGRFTHAETSHSRFGWPGLGGVDMDDDGRADDSNGDGIADADPHHPQTQMQLNIAGNPNGDHQVQRFTTIGSAAADTRAAEDVVLTNVHEFDIQVWDAGQINDTSVPPHVSPNIPAGFYDLGSPQSARWQWTRPTNNGVSYQDPTLSPIGPVYDTWHPSLENRNDGSGGTIENPDRPFARPPMMPLSMTQTYTDWRDAGNYNAGDVVISPNGGSGALAFRARLRNPEFTGDPNANPQPAQTPPPPERWPTVLGAEVKDGDFIWTAIDNRVGLKMIRIRIRYFDPGSRLMRQVTLVHSLVDE